MRRKLTIAAVIGLSASLAQPVQAAQTVLPANGKWVLDYDTDRCVLSRRFGSEQAPAFLQFIRYGPSDHFDFNIIGRAFGTSSNLPDLRLRFGETGPFVTKRVLTGQLGGMPMVLGQGRLDNLPSDDWDDVGSRPAVTPATEAAVTRVHVSLGGRRWIFAMGAMDKPMAALRTCETSLVKQWGLDPEQQASLAETARPLSSPARWVVSGDYPDSKLFAGEQAIVAFRLMVDPAGVPTGCSVQSNIARDKTFADLTCKALLRRARFSPARLADGTPVASYHINRVVFIIP